MFQCQRYVVFEGHLFQSIIQLIQLKIRAHHWDHRSPALAEIGGPVAERLYQEGLAARASQDWQLAFDRFSAALRVEPFRAWARRYAEEARDHRLGLHDREKTPWVKPRGGAGAKAKAKAP